MASPLVPTVGCIGAAPGVAPAGGTSQATEARNGLLCPCGTPPGPAVLPQPQAPSWCFQTVARLHVFLDAVTGPHGSANT